MVNQKLKNKIEEIGQRIFKCSKKCEGVRRREPEEGVIPRGLILDDKDRASNKGIVIVGINPGSPAKKSAVRKCYETCKGYSDVIECWDKHVKYKDNGKGKGGRYYKGLCKLIEKFGCKNHPILWTELVKCEWNENKPLRKIKRQTIGTCSKEYLCEELKCDSISSWPIIAVGVYAYMTLLELGYCGRTVIGVYHPNSRGYFSGFLKEVKWNNKFFKRLLNDGNASKPKCCWLPDITRPYKK